MSQEGAAISLLTRAVDLDNKKRFTESLVCYKEGLQLLMEVLKNETNESKKKAFREKAAEYMTRAEQISKKIEQDKQSGQFHEQVKIAANSVGHSYETLMGRFMDENVKTVHVEDPYIRSHHQIVQFLRFCELLVKKCSNLNQINLLTSQDPSPSPRKEQIKKFDEMTNDLKSRNIDLSVSYSDTLHDREIRLNTGWLIKIGRGLDLYQAPRGKMVVGIFDLDLRPCHETTVDIFHKMNLKRL